MKKTKRKIIIHLEAELSKNKTNKDSFSPVSCGVDLNKMQDAIKYVKASMEHEGFTVTRENIHMMKQVYMGKMTAEQVIQAAIKKYSKEND